MSYKAIAGFLGMVTGLFVLRYGFKATPSTLELVILTMIAWNVYQIRYKE